MQQHRLARRLLALMFILSTLTVIFSTTPLPASSTPQTQVQIIESDDPLVVQEGSWTSQNTPQASGGKYLYSGGSTSDVLTLEFTGSAIDIYYVTHSTFGSFAIEIDNNIRRTVVTTSKETTFGNIASVNYLDDTPHTLRVYPVEGVVAIDAFFATLHIQSVEEGSATSALSSSVRFIPNMGQFDDEVRFEAQGANGTAYYTDNEVVLVLPASPESTELTEPRLGPDERSTEETVPDIVRMQFEGANTDPNILSLQRLPGEINYFVGNDNTDWHTNVPIYGAIHYEDLYPGVDIIFDETSGVLQGTFTIDGGVDLSQIRWRYEGATNLRVDEVTGELLFEVVPNAARTSQVESATPAQHRQPAPSAWQETGGQRAATSIDLHYTINTDGTVGFAAQGYNATQPLTIAPFSGGGMMEAAVVEEPASEVSFSSYLGGSATFDYIWDVAADSSGNMYVTGDMPSSAINGGIIGIGGNSSTFVAKFNSDNTLDFITYVGGSSLDYSEGIDVDSSGNVYITGYTGSTNFPVHNAYQATCTVPSSCGWEAFVVKISASGSTLLYGTYLGDTATDWARAIAVDDNNQVYVTGFTDTVNDWNDCTYPYCDNDAKGHDFFVVKLDLNETGIDQLEYGAIWGGAGGAIGYADDDPTDIAIDSQGNVVVVGYTNTIDFPTTPNVFQPDCIEYGTNICASAFVTVFVAVNDSLGFHRSSYLDGSSVDDEAYSVAFDAASNIYIAGDTNSTDFPTPNGFQTSSINNVGYYHDGFLVKMPFDLSDVVYGTYLSGGDWDSAFGVDVNDIGVAYVTGFTQSTDFPTTTDAIQATNNGDNDVFFARIDTGQTGLASLLESTYWGGSYSEQGNGIAEADGMFYVAGSTISTDLPIVNGYQTGNGGAQDGFMLRLQTVNPTCVIYVESQIQIKAYNTVVHPRTEKIRGSVLPPENEEIISFQEGDQLLIDLRYLEYPNLPSEQQVLDEQTIVRVIAYNLSTDINDPTYVPAAAGWVEIDPNAASNNEYLWINTSPEIDPPNINPRVDIVRNHVGNTEEPDELGGDCGVLNIVSRGQLDPALSVRDIQIERIRDYHIEIGEYGQQWEQEELENVGDAASLITSAFDRIGATYEYVPHSFINIMINNPPLDYVLMLRLGSTAPTNPNDFDNRYYIIGTEDNIGTPNGECGYFDSVLLDEIQYPPVIACRGDILASAEWDPMGLVTVEAFVHEFGHVFDSRTGLVLRNNIQHDLSENPTELGVMRSCGFVLDNNGDYPRDDNEQLILTQVELRERNAFMGHIPDWSRGSAGWGSPAGQANFSQFQQNGDDTVYEAVADMFLNWVFRRNTTGPPVPYTDPCEGPFTIGNDEEAQTWQGFLNIDEFGRFDPQLPGNVRFAWMEDQISTILDDNSWLESN